MLSRRAAPAPLITLAAVGVAAILVATLGGGCKREAEPPQSAAPAAPAPAAAAAAPSTGSGTIKGIVLLTGTPPERKEVNMKADPYCAKQQGTKDEEVVSGAGGALKNVVVHIASGLTEKYNAPAEDVTIDQNGCMYRPRVVAVSAGQTVIIKNSDQTLHNVHTYSGPSTLFNQAQVFGMAPLRKKFPAAGDVVKFKCDVHPWMTGYVLVTANPFRAVTGDDGTFTINDVPAGNYTLEIWHERLGTKQVPVTVAVDKPAQLKVELEAK